MPIALAGTFIAGMATESATNAIDEVKDTVAEVFDNDLHFSDEKSAVVTEQGDTLWNIANMVENSDKVNDLHIVVDYIESLPENEAIFDDNGNLRTGVQVFYPSRIEIY